MTEDNKPQNKEQSPTTQTQTQNSQSPESNSKQGVWGSKYLASEEEHRQFANAHPGEIVFGFGTGHHPKK
jgi:hypothetical protein